MLLIISSTIFLSLSLSIIISSSPLSIGLWILLIALSASWLRSILFNTWFAIIIFLIYIGGILVIFAYFTALTPNQPLEIITIWTSFLSAFTLTLFLIYISNSSSSLLLSPIISFHTPSITSLLFPKNIFIILLLAISLFFILVAVVKIATLSKGPLRPFK